MSTTRNYFNFFPRLQSISSKKIYDNFLWAYEHSPINFSSLTGLHHPGITRLPGNILWGRLRHAAAEGGSKFNDEFFKLADKAVHDPRGMAYCTYGNLRVLLVSNPSDVEQVAIHNDAKLERSEIIKSFTHIFGEKNIFSLPTSQDWKEKRIILKEWIFNEAALHKLTGPMQKIIDEYIEGMKSKEEIPSLEDFTITFAMDLFTRSVFGSQSIAKEALEVSKTYNSALIASNNPVNVFLLKLSAISEYIHIKTTHGLDHERAKLQDVLIKSFLKPNYEHLKKSKNLLQHHFQNESKDVDVQCLEAYEEAAAIILAGHETTSRLLQFTLILLTEHPDKLAKLREEILSKRPIDGEWTLEGLKNMVYLRKVLKETLRLFPPVPAIPRMVTEAFPIGEIPRCVSRADYFDAMKNRDQSKDIIIPKGCLIFISPWVTQRLLTVHEKPLEFRPERFKSDSLSLSGDDKSQDDRCAWFPFGLGRHDCVGRNIAMLEAQLSLIQLVEKFNFTVTPADNNTRLLDTYMQGTLKHKGIVKMKFSARFPDVREHKLT